MMQIIYKVIISCLLCCPLIADDCGWNPFCHIKKFGEETVTPFFEKKVFEDVLKPAGQGIVDAASKAQSFMGEHFTDTKLTRAADYAIRKAALVSAKEIATGSLQAMQATSLAPLIASREIAQGTLNATQQFLEKVGKNVTSMALAGTADLTHKLLSGVQKGSELTLDGAQAVINYPLSMVDINRIYYKGSLENLAGGVLGSVNIECMILKKTFSSTISLDPKAGLTALTSAFKPVITSIVQELQHAIDKTIDTVDQVVNEKHNQVATIVNQGKDLEATVKRDTISVNQLTAGNPTLQATKQYDQSKEEIVSLLKKQNDAADQALKNQAASAAAVP